MRRIGRLVLLGASFWVMSNCQCGGAGPQPEDGGSTDSGTDAGADGGADAGCTPRSEAASYPVKVMFVVDSGGKMCIADPPGSQAGSPFCDGFTLPDGGQSGRVRAITAFQAANAGAGSWVSLSKFDMVQRPLPAVAPWFMPTATLTSAQIASVASNLGKGDDLQGALEAAADHVEADIAAASPTGRARTRYLVVVLSAGFPYPRCAANDSLGSYASASDPSGTWADSAPSFCNAVPSGLCDPATGRDDAGIDCIPGFSDAGDRDQNGQLFAAVDRIVGLKARYGVGDIRVHTGLLFDAAEFASCGVVCTGSFGGMNATDARTVGAWKLQQIATRGNGTFVDPGSPQSLTLGDLDVTPLATFCP